MTTDVETISENESLEDALKRMVNRNVGCVVVVDGKSRVPLGMLTERDISRSVAKGIDSLKERAKDVMSSPLITEEPDGAIQGAIELMLKRGIRHLPILQNHQLVGIITDRDLLRWVIEVFYEPNIPTEFKQIIEQPVHSKK